MKKRTAMFCLGFFVLAALPASATTFVIKENGMEVGRWEEADGSTKTEVIENDKKPAASASSAPSAASEAASPESAKNMWKVAGRVVDLINLQSLVSGEIIFRYEGQEYPFPVKGGTFHGQIPAQAGHGYTVVVKAPGYNPAKVYVLVDDAFMKKDYALRLRGWAGSPPHTTITGSVLNMEVGLCRLELTAREKKDLSSLVQSS